MDAAARWIAVHDSLIQAIGFDALLGLAAWIVLACGQVSLGTAGFATVGAFVSMRLAGLSHWPVAWAGGAGVLAAALVAYLLGFVFVRRSHAQFAIGTLCVGVLASMTLRIPAPTAGMHREPALAIYAALFACLYATWRLMQSREGRAIRATAQDESAASGLGIDPSLYKHAAFVASAVVAAVAGVFAALGGYAGAGFGPARSVDALAFAVVGGSGAVAGPLIGAALLGLAPLVFPRVNGYATAVDAALLLLCACAFPGGAWSAVSGMKRLLIASRGGAS